MNILLATATFPPFKDGVAQAAAAQAHAFTAEGHKVCVATEPHADRRAGKGINRLDVREFRIHGSPHFRNPYAGDTSRYVECLKEEPWDVIIFHSYLWPLLVASPHLSRLRGKTILTSHGYGALMWTPVRRFPYGLGSLLWSFARSLEMLRWYKHLDRVVFLNSKVDGRAFYDHFLANICGHQGIRIIPNGVDIPDLQSGPPARDFLDFYGIPRTKHLFLCVANYSWRKDQLFALRAFREAALLDSTLVFIGSELNECSAAFQQADTDSLSNKSSGKVYWLEKVSRGHTLGALQACDTFILSANHEAQPIALLEAMSYAKPWIARHAGCIDRMEGGLCVKSVHNMAKAMRLVATDSALQTQLGLSGRQAVEGQYSASGYSRAYCQLLGEVTKR
jgi:glycosyltransferase involved in cell wall biosynthesis